MGLRPKPRQEALPPGPPPKGEALWNLSIGFVLRGGPTRTLQGRGRLSPENKTINGFEGPPPFAGFQGAEPLGGVSGRSPALHRHRRSPHGGLTWRVRRGCLPPCISPRSSSPPAPAAVSARRPRNNFSRFLASRLSATPRAR